MRERRHILYHSLLEAAAQAGCPVCRCLRPAEGDWIRRLLAEHVTDAEFRKRWVKSAGLCRRHAHQLAEIGDAPGTAILYEDLVVRLLKGPLGDAAARPKSFRAWLHTPGQLPRCPACEHLADYEDRLIEGLCRHAPEREMYEALDAGDGLCLPHLVSAVAVARRDVVDYLLKRHRERWVGLARRLRELIDTFDQSRRPPEGIADEVKQAYREAIDILTGLA